MQQKKTVFYQIGLLFESFYIPNVLIINPLILKEFILEANFQNSNKGSQKWSYGDFNKIANIAPVKIVEMKGEKNITTTCSTTDIQEPSVLNK